MGQGGNVWEWNETAYDGTNNTAGESRELRGGSWDNSSNLLDASSRSVTVRLLLERFRRRKVELLWLS